MNPLDTTGGNTDNKISRKVVFDDIQTSEEEYVPESDTWMDRANCKGQTDKMFPKGHKDISYIAGARALCRGCDVREECLEYALQFPPADMHGVWAGLTSRQLLEEQRRRGVKATRPTISGLWGTN
jgi:WhiB family redox-sensing transcriptional regulator